MKKLSTQRWAFYAALSGLLSAIIMESARSVIDFSEQASYLLPGILYGGALYISGIAGQRFSSPGQHIIALVTLPTGSAIAWYAAAKSPYYFPLGGGLFDLKQMILAGFTGAFIISLLLIFCWHIKYRRNYFALCISLTGATVPILWYIIKYIGEILNIYIENIIFFALWQSILLISASLFISTTKKSE